MYVVNQSAYAFGKMTQSYGRNFETMDDAIDYYDDIDLAQEFGIEYVTSPQEAHGSLKVDKSLFDCNGTLDRYDFYDYSDYRDRR